MSKSKNGQAKSATYLLAFDLQDEAERRAWGVTQSLAAERRLKHTLLGFLLALAEIRDHTGRDHSVEEMMAAFVSSIVMGDTPINFARPLRLGDLSEDVPPLIVGSANHADPDEARNQLALDMGDLFGDEDW